MAGESARELARRARGRAEGLERRAEMFERGADGEEATAATLFCFADGMGEPARRSVAQPEAGEQRRLLAASAEVLPGMDSPEPGLFDQ